jgi:NAD(P)-dependent dehydrogenase (short-subunit alcohol dehydrogenase family)
VRPAAPQRGGGKPHRVDGLDPGRRETPGPVVGQRPLPRRLDDFPGLAAYNESKYGIIGLTDAIAVEGKPHHISAICVSPGAVDTEMLRRANPALRPGLTPDDVAELIVALLDSPLAPASGANIPLFSNA